MYTLNKNQMFVTDKLLIATPEGKKNGSYGNSWPATKHLIYIIIYFYDFVQMFVASKV